jgi:transposase-like protein
VKRITNPMLGFKSFWSAQKLLAGIETMHMVKKGQLDCSNGQPMSAAAQFYSLAF